MSGSQLRIVVLLIVMAGLGAYVAWVYLAKGGDVMAGGTPSVRSVGPQVVKPPDAPAPLFKPHENLTQVQDTRQVLKHIDAVRQLRNKSFTEQMLDAAKDSRKEVVVEAIGALDSIPVKLEDPSVILSQIPDQKADALVRQKAIMFAAHRHYYNALPDIVNCMEENDKEMRATAYAAVRMLTSNDFHYNPNASQAERDRVMKLIRHVLGRKNDLDPVP